MRDEPITVRLTGKLSAFVREQMQLRGEDAVAEDVVEEALTAFQKTDTVKLRALLDEARRDTRPPVSDEELSARLRALKDKLAGNRQ